MYLLLLLLLLLSFEEIKSLNSEFKRISSALKSNESSRSGLKPHPDEKALKTWQHSILTVTFSSLLVLNNN